MTIKTPNSAPALPRSRVSDTMKPRSNRPSLPLSPTPVNASGNSSSNGKVPAWKLRTEQRNHRAPRRSSMGCMMETKKSAELPPAFRNMSRAGSCPNGLSGSNHNSNPRKINKYVITQKDLDDKKKGYQDRRSNIFDSMDSFM